MPYPLFFRKFLLAAWMVSIRQNPRELRRVQSFYSFCTFCLDAKSTQKVKTEKCSSCTCRHTLAFPPGQLTRFLFRDEILVKECEGKNNLKVHSVLRVGVHE